MKALLTFPCLALIGAAALVASPVTKAQTFTDHYDFQGGADGGNPFGALIADSAGNLYGTTYAYGMYGANCSYPGCGVVYKLDSVGNETPLYTFGGSPDGQNPVAGVVADSAGNFYGTTAYGGAYGYGTVYMLNAAGTEKVLRSFTGGADGGIPNAGVVRDKDGNLFGVTFTGGSAGLGTLYKVTADGAFSTLYTFADIAHGAHPNATLLLDGDGILYGTTQYGGAANRGTVFSFDPSGGSETVLYSFSGADGAYPQSPLVKRDGALYGTTTEGGATNNGTVFKLAGSSESVLYSFNGAPDGSYPIAGVVLDKTGNAYGTTLHGGGSGSPGAGTVYKLDTSGHESVLYAFQGSFDGQNPTSGLLLNPTAKAVYGTTYAGGFDCCGDVFSVTLP